jgi:hypothetical protein
MDQALPGVFVILLKADSVTKCATPGQTCPDRKKIHQVQNERWLIDFWNEIHTNTLSMQDSRQKKTLTERITRMTAKYQTLLHEWFDQVWNSRVYSR